MGYRMGRGFGDLLDTSQGTVDTTTFFQRFGFGGPPQMPSTPPSPGNVWVVTPAGTVQVPLTTIANVGVNQQNGFFVPSAQAYLGNSSFLTTITTGWGNNTGVQGATDQALNVVPAVPVPIARTSTPVPPPAQMSTPLTAAPSSSTLISSGLPTQVADMGAGLNFPASVGGFSFSSMPWWGWGIGAAIAVWAVSKA